MVQQSQAELRRRDTIPASLKDTFFANSNAPNLLQDYDVLGFDADHCLVKYKLPQKTRLVCDITADDLCTNYGYPEELRHWPPSLSAIALNNVIWDIEHRTLLKLGEGKIIVQAFRGSQRISESEIVAIYGSPPIFEAFNYPTQTVSDLSKIEGAHGALMTYFDCSRAPVIAHALDLLQKGVIKDKTDLEFAKDLVKSIMSQHVHWNKEECQPIVSFGSFFAAIMADPSNYIVYQPELRQRLEQLKAHGMKLFLGTNSHYEYMHVIMKASLGDDWQQLFDLNIANCRKP